MAEGKRLTGKGFSIWRCPNRLGNCYKKIMDYIQKNYTKIQAVDSGAYYVWKINGYAKHQQKYF